MAIPSIRWLRRIAIALVVIAALVLPSVLVVALPEATTAFVTTITKLIPPLSRPLVIVLVAQAILLLIAAIWWLWWRLPRRQLHKLDVQIHDPKARADTEDNFRKTVGQALGGVAVLIGAGAAYLQFTQQQRTATEQIVAQQKIASDQITTQMVSKGFEQLANKDSVVMRIGGIYALESVMNTSEQYHGPVLEALCVFVRDGTLEVKPATDPHAALEQKPATDIQAALTVIGRRNTEAAAVAERVEGTIVLRLIRPGMDLSRANIPGAELIQAHLEGAGLAGTHLEGADLLWAHLEGAHLWGAHLEHANLFAAYLGGAELIQAHLERANLSQAHLERANLSQAHLEGAHLAEARGLTQAQINEALGDAVTKLPEGLTRPAHWPAQP